MNKKMILAIAAILAMGLGVLAFAYTNTIGTASTTASCCCLTGDSCPLKSHHASSKEAALCCDDCGCCNGDYCPMKEKSVVAKTSMDTEHDEKDVNEKTCCCPCCNQNKERIDAPNV